MISGIPTHATYSQTDTTVVFLSANRHPCCSYNTRAQGYQGTYIGVTTTRTDNTRPFGWPDSYEISLLCRPDRGARYSFYAVIHHRQPRLSRAQSDRFLFCFSRHPTNAPPPPNVPCKNAISLNTFYIRIKKKKHHFHIYGENPSCQTENAPSYRSRFPRGDRTRQLYIYTSPQSMGHSPR